MQCLTVTLKTLFFQCHIFLVRLHEMENSSLHKILSYIGSIDHDLTNQLMIVDIDNYHVLFLLSAIYIHKKIQNLLSYNFTYNQRCW